VRNVWSLLEESETKRTRTYCLYAEKKGHDTFVKLGKQRMYVGMRDYYS
jgi:hypothetical protein